LNDEIEPVWVEVGRFPALGEAEQHALVLVASGVASRLVPNAAGIALFVAAPDAARARYEIAAYAQENGPRPAPGPALRPLREGIDAALMYCVVLVFIHAAASRGAFSHDWLAIGHAQASLIKGGEWWRAVTALGLHADLGHLLANVTLGGILGVLLAQLLGAGLAWLAILIGGGIGNAIVAVLAPAEHTAIGASTSVFAALGLLAALAWGRQAMVWRGLRRWRPIAAAVMLLALLGVGGERTDIGAHVAGLLTGCVAGVGLYFARPYLPLGRKAQLAFGATAIGLFAGSWLAAFASVKVLPIAPV
jgi:membrane associated rhomboid family serine protease